MSDCEAKHELLEHNSNYLGVENKMRVRAVSICTQVRSTGLSMEFSLQRSHFPGHNPNSSLGPDGIHLRALNQPKDEITPLQAAVCTSPWESSVSGNGKVGKWLIFTKDSRGDLRNYGWVNMMSLFSKSVEATARNRMSRHMEKYIGKHSIKHL